MNIKCIILWSLLVCSAVHGATIYNTGFETQNEPFGAVNRVNDALLGPATAKLSQKVSNSGTQSVTPGAGSGGYGKYLTKKFNPGLKNRVLWLQYYFKPSSVDYPKYKSFVIIKGGSTKNSNAIKAASILFYSNRIVVGTGKYYNFDLTLTWHKVKIKLDLKTQSYNLYIGENFIQRNIPFTAKIKNYGQVANISQILLGGGTSAKHLTFFDDLYIGTTPPVTTAVSSKVTNSINNNAFITLNRTVDPPNIDGKATDSVWQHSSPTTPFLTIDGKLNKFQPTTVRMSYDAQNLYLLFECFDMQLNPVMNQLAEIKKNAKGQDDGNVFKDDSVEIFLAPNPDKPSEYYQFAISASGAVFDQKLPVPGVKWNGKIEKAITFNDKSWIVEVKIPFASLGLKTPHLASKWNINLCRCKPSLGEISCWNPTGNSFHNYNSWGQISFNQQQPTIIAKLPELLTEGSNQVKFTIKNSHSKSVIVSTHINYKHADRVGNTQQTAIDKFGTIASEVIIYTKTELRRTSRSCNITYQLHNPKSGKLLFATPDISLPLAKNSPLKTRFLAESSGAYFVFFDDLYINQQSSLHRMLLIQYAKELTGKFKTVELIINMPDYMSLVKPTGKGKIWAPLRVMERIVKGKDGQRREYILTYPASLTYLQKKLGLDNRYNQRPSLVFYCSKVLTKPKTDYLSYYSQIKLAGKIVREPIRKMPLTVLPAINGRMPKKILIISSFGNYNNTLSNLNIAEQQRCLENMTKAGFNMLSYMDLKKNLFSDKLLQLIRHYGLKIEKAFFAKQKAWIRDTITGQHEYLKKNPQYRAVDGNGIVHNNSVAISHKLTPGNGFMPFIKQALSAAAKKSDSILWDHEMRQLGPESLGYDRQSLKDFSKYLKLSKPVTIKETQTIYRKQWIKFQCKRNAELGKLMAKVVREANPKCLFNVYSGYQSWSHQAHYGVDWKLFSKFIDNAECGYRRPRLDITNTLQAIGNKKLITGELIACNTANAIYDMSKLKINLFRRLTDSTGGILLFYDLQVDGRFWLTVGELSRMVADNEEFFIAGKKSSNTVKIISGIKSNDLVVYELANGKKLLVVFNPKGISINCAIKVLQMPASAIIKDYYSHSVIRGNTLAVTIKPYDVKVFIIK